MYSLFIDTHEKNVLIILYKDGKFLIKEDIVSQNKHSQVALPTIIKVLEDAKINVKDLKEIIVVNGPGSFTGERIAVTIAKTMAYALSIPIKVIDSLVILAINVNKSEKSVALEDRNGAFIGLFDENNNKKEEFKYLDSSTYLDFKNSHDVVNECEIDYEKVFNYMESLPILNPHEVKPLYIKGISALNDK